MATKEEDPDTPLTGDRKTRSVFVAETPPTDSTPVQVANTSPVVTLKKDEYIQGTPPRRRDRTDIIDSFDNKNSELVKLLRADSQSLVFSHSMISFFL